MRMEDRTPILIWLPLLIALVVMLAPRPARLDAAWQSIQATSQTGTPEKGLDELYLVVEYQPWRADVWEQIGGGEQQRGNLAAARRAFEQAGVTGELSPAGYLAWGQVLAQSGEVQAAQRIWQELLERENQPQVYHELVRSQIAQGDLTAAEASLRRWLAVDARPQVRYELGLVLLAERPRQGLDELLAAGREDARLLPEVETLRRAVNLAGLEEDSAYQKLAIGRGLGRIGRWDLAFYLFEEATRLSPDYAEAWAFLAEARQQTGQGDGWKELRRAQELAPHSVITQALLALRWSREGHPELARDYLLSVAQQEPEQAIWQIELGNLYQQMGDVKEAMTHYQRATEVEPLNPAAWGSLAAFSATSGLYLREVGLPAARQALLLQPEDAGALDRMGWVLLALGDSASAERFLQRALLLDGNYAPAHLHLGQVYLNLNQIEAARLHLLRAIELDGEGAVGSLARRLLDRFGGG